MNRVILRAPMTPVESRAKTDIYSPKPLEQGISALRNPRFRT